jgi:tRNA (cytidine56-2'-O)-methyltransferase
MGHRKNRDPRLSSHVALTARAFGAEKMLFSGDEDPELVKSIGRVTSNWGGLFSVQYVKSWKPFLKNWNMSGKSVQLTMYGLNIYDVVEEIRSCDRNLLVIVGGQKVPREVYELVDWNVSITSQPHSEVSALAVFLHILLDGGEFKTKFPGARIRIIPCPRGKKVVRSTSSLFSS